MKAFKRRGLIQDASGRIARTIRARPCSGDGAQLVLPVTPYQERLERYTRTNPDWVQPEYRRRDAGFIRQGLEDSRSAREGGLGIPFPIREDGSSSRSRRLVGSGGRHGPLLFDALTTTCGPWASARIRQVRTLTAADLHVIGKDINRLHTIMWPAMLMSAGWRPARSGSTATCSSRAANEQEPGQLLDPIDVVAASGRTGPDTVTLREVAFDRRQRTCPGTLSYGATTRTWPTTSASGHRTVSNDKPVFRR